MKNNSLTYFVFVLIFTAMSGCVTPEVPSFPPPQWSPVSQQFEAEYEPFFKEGTGRITGQAFMNQQGGGVVKGAGATITLDPATSVGREWWAQAGSIYQHRYATPASPNFHAARRTYIADADGNFFFEGLPAGTYYVRSEIVWRVGYTNQGGLIGTPVIVKEGQTSRVILNQFIKAL